MKNLVALPAFTDHIVRMLHDGLAAIAATLEHAAPVFALQGARRLRHRGILVIGRGALRRAVVAGRL
ncbi:MAG TPA: hypothetical protein VLA16_17255 [Ideonella sp.]|nr:hypothetical protein [Ideonella sp.]